MSAPEAIGENRRSANNSILKEVLTASTLYSVALIAQRLASFILFPLYTRALTPSDYGLLDLMDQATSLWGMLLGAQFASALFYFFFLKDSTEWRAKVVSTTLLGATVLGLFSGGIGMLLATPLSRAVLGTSDYARYFLLLFASLAVSFPIEACFCWLKAENAAARFVQFSVFRLLLTIGITLILLLGFKMGVKGVLWSNLISGCVLLLLAGSYCLRHIQLAFDWSLFRRMCWFSAPLGLSGVALFIMHFGDRFILKQYAGLIQVGLYSAGYKIGMLISYVHSSFHTYWSSQVYQIVRRPDGKRIYARAFTYMVLLLTTCGLALTFFSRPLLTIMASSSYWPAASIVPLIVLAYFVRAVGDFFRCVLFVKNRPGLDATYNWIGAAVGLAAYFLLIPKLGMFGAAIATVIIFVVVGVVAAWSAHRMLPYPLEGRRIGKIVGCAGLALAFCWAIRAQSFGAECLTGMGSLLLFALALRILNFATAEEWCSARAGILALRRRFA